MSKKAKLIARLKAKPKDFTFDEMISLLGYFGYKLDQSKSGSGVKFTKQGDCEVINFHKPYPDGVLKRYILNQVLEKLEKENLI